jgi:hypothetical protein
VLDGIVTYFKWYGMVVAYFEALCRYSYAGTEKRHDKPESGQPKSLPGTSWIRSRSADHYTATFGPAARGTHSTATGHSGQIHPLATAGLEPRQSSCYNSFIPTSVLSTRQWPPSYSILLLFEYGPGDLHLTNIFVILLSSSWQMLD